MFLAGRHFETGNAVRLRVTQGLITELDELQLPAEEVQSLPWLAPGLFDIQVNGAQGVWFSDERLNVESVCDVLSVFLRHGVTRLFPTLITNSAAALEHGFAVINRACEQAAWVDRMVAGCHLEGPYLSAETGPRGAHPREHIRGCNWNEFARWQAASGNRIKLVTLAPEATGAVEFIQRFTATGGVIALGHTAADTTQIAAAVAAGARLSTHFGNGAHGTLRRHPNYLWDQLAEPRLLASLITDGQHLPASVAKVVLLAKGPQNIILTCDASGLAGCPPGEYAAVGGRCEVLTDGRIVVAGQRQYLAGSSAFTEQCIAGMCQLTGVDLATAWHMATRNPGRLFDVKVPELRLGAAAEIVVFRIVEQRNTAEQGSTGQATIASGIQVERVLNS